MTTTYINNYKGVFKKTRTVLIIAFFPSILSMSFAQSPCTLGNFNGSYTLNANDYPYYSPGSGVTVSLINVGVSTLSNFTYSCGGVPFATVAPAFWINAAAPTQSLTFNFSEPVCTFSVVVNGTNLNEEFYFAAATGSIQLSDYCTAGFAPILGNTALRCTISSATGTLITVNNPVGSTSYVLTHNGTGSGSRYALKDCFVVCSPLPVELSSFDVTCDNEATKITWETAAEINNDYFTVWRSDDGEKFIPISTIDGLENSNQLTEYEWTDERVYNKASYYRLSQTDLNGETEFFDPQVFYGCNVRQPIISTVQFDEVKIIGESIQSATIYDQTGRILLDHYNLDHSEKLVLNPTVQKGFYIIKVVHHDGNISSEIVYLEK